MCVVYWKIEKNYDICINNNYYKNILSVPELLLFLKSGRRSGGQM